jgi:metal transporter CNNM
LESKSAIHRLLIVAHDSREIIDESDVFIDVHKAIRRMTPAPRARVPRGKVVNDISRKPSEVPATDDETEPEQNGMTAPRKTSMPETSDAPQKPSFMLRRRSSGSKGTMSPLRSDDPSVMQHLKHLGPSNAANRPKQTRINTVKIKPGQTSLIPDIPKTIPENALPAAESTRIEDHAPQGGVGEGLLASAGRDASDAVHSVAVNSVGYGTMATSGDRMSWKEGRSGPRETEEDLLSPKGGANENDESAHLIVDNRNENDESRGRSRSVSTIASLKSVRSRSRSPLKKRHTARSGSISENVVDVNGIKKVVLETNSSSDSEDKTAGSQADGHEEQDDQQRSEAESSQAGGNGGSKKKRKKRGKKKKGGPGNGSETQPLLGDR